jgi:hypothetical protein
MAMSKPAHSNNEGHLAVWLEDLPGARSSTNGGIERFNRTLEAKLGSWMETTEVNIGVSA